MFDFLVLVFGRMRREGEIQENELDLPINTRQGDLEIQNPGPPSHVT